MDTTTTTAPDAVALVERLRVDHVDALDEQNAASVEHEKRGTEETRERLQACRQYTASVTRALAVAYDERGALAPDVPSQALVTVGPRDGLRETDIRSRVPDAMQGARHETVSKRSTSGRTDTRVIRRGVAPVIGDTHFDVERLADMLDVEDASARALLVDMLASDALADVRRLTLGASSLDVERATSALLAALDVDPLDGTDATAWHNVETVGALDVDPLDVDARTQAVLAGESLDVLTAMSRHRAGITGGGIAPDVVLDVVRTVVEHGTLDERRTVTVSRGVTVSSLADVTAVTVETASWPKDGPRSCRPGVPRWRASERDTLVVPKRVDPLDDESRVLYWHAPDVETVLAPASTVSRPFTAPVLLAGQMFTVERVAGRSPRQRDAAPVAPSWQYRAGLVADSRHVEHVERVEHASERVHIGVETVDRGARATTSRKRASTRAARREVEILAAARRADVVDHVAPDVERVRAVLALLDVEESRDAVTFSTDRTTVRVKRGASGRFDIREHGLRLAQPRGVMGAVDAVAAALALDE